MIEDEIVFQPVMDGIKRKLNIKVKVSGYRHTVMNNIHIFQRGNTVYVFDTKEEAVIMRKFNCLKCEYVGISYEEVHRFIEIMKQNELHRQAAVMPKQATGNRHFKCMKLLIVCFY